MSKYVKEMMMDQLKTDLDGSRSLLILDLNGLDATAEWKLRNDLRKKSIRIRALKNTLARRVFADMGIEGLSPPQGAVDGRLGGGRGRRARQGDLTQVKALKKPQIKGGAVDGIVVGPEQVEDITKLPSREALIGRVVSMACPPPSGSSRWPMPRPARLMSQLKTMAEKGRPRGRRWGAAAEGEAGARRRGARPGRAGGPRPARGRPAPRHGRSARRPDRSDES